MFDCIQYVKLQIDISIKNEINVFKWKDQSKIIVQIVYQIF